MKISVWCIDALQCMVLIIVCMHADVLTYPGQKILKHLHTTLKINGMCPCALFRTSRTEHTCAHLHV
jgi:hypothetical protein